VRPNDVYQTIEYLSRVIPRGHQEELDILRLIDSLKNLAKPAKGKKAA
jgi:hypothetical protein